MPDQVLLSRLRARGVPDPDGTPLGDVEHTLAVCSALSADFVVLVATSGVYGEDEGMKTGISMGDLRALLRLARLGAHVLEYFQEE